MPSAAEHELKSEHNWSFVSFVEGGSTSFDDWVVTGLFYVAVHQVERLLAKKANKHCHTHGARNKWLATLSDFKPIWKDYRELQYLSETARYGASGLIGASEVSDAKACLHTIEKQIKHCL